MTPATPELNAALRARLEELLGEYGKVRGNLARMREKLAAAEGTASSPDGGLRVTVASVNLVSCTWWLPVAARQAEDARALRAH